MGRKITINTRVGGGSAAEVMIGEALLEPTNMHKVGTATVFPAPTKVAIINGVAEFPDVEPSPAGPLPEWCYKLVVREVRSGRAWSKLVGVPAGTGALTYNDLTVFQAVPANATPGFVDLVGEATDAKESAAASLLLAQQSATSAAASAGLVGAPAGAAVDAAIKPGGAANASLNAANVSRATLTGVYIPSGTAAERWRATREAVNAGTKQGHISILGDSIAYGAAATGSTPPKARSSWPGRLRSMLDTEKGMGGTGAVPAIPEILTTNPEWDPRWAFGGAGVTNFTFGMHRSCDYRLTLENDYVEFTAYCSEFVMYTAAGGTYGYASVDGAAEKTFKNTTGAITGPGDTPQLPPLFTTAGQPIITVVPAGALGLHKLRIRRGAGAADIHVLAVEARIPTNGTYRVTNFGYSGKSLSSSGMGAVNNDEANALYGRPIMFDMLDADLAIIALGVNDWQSSRTIADTKVALTNAVQRQRSTANNSQGRPHPGGDAVLLWNPRPDTATLATTSVNTWQEHRDTFYEVATEQNCVLIDLGQAWEDFPAANAAGLFADKIHPTDKGAFDVAKRVHSALFHEIY